MRVFRRKPSVLKRIRGDGCVTYDIDGMTHKAAVDVSELISREYKTCKGDTQVLYHRLQRAMKER